VHQADLLARCGAAGIALALDGDRTVYDAPDTAGVAALLALADRTVRSSRQVGAGLNAK
jgi:hypothetical protein